MCVCVCVCVCVCARVEGKGKYNVRIQKGIPGNPVEKGMPLRQGRHMALSGPLAGDQSENKHRWIILSKQSCGHSNLDAQKKHEKKKNCHSVHAELSKHPNCYLQETP